MTLQRRLDPGDRVWIKLDANSWWPAKVIHVEDEETRSGAVTGGVVTVSFYGDNDAPTTTTRYSLHSGSIAYFETSSQKAVTSNQKLLAAIRSAEEDEDANALRFDYSLKAAEGESTSKVGDAVVSTASAAKASIAALNKGAAGSQRATVTKRQRDASGWSQVDNLFEGGQLSTDRLVEVANIINRAVEENDAPSLRSTLFELDNVVVSLQQLKLTKVGVAVGNILGKNELQELWPISRAIISSWARALPKETIATIQSHQRYRKNRCRNDETQNSQTNGVTAMGSMPRDNNNGATTTSHETNVGTGNNSQISFLSRVQQLLVHPDDPHVSTVTSEDLRAVAQELCSEIVQLEDRKHLLKHLEKPGLSALRQKLATRVLSGREFLKLGRDELMTEEEKQLEEQRITKIIEEQEKVSLANVAVTSLFKCPACGENRCSFYEQQIRSADEPTTKFLRCLECNNAWTTE